MLLNKGAQPCSLWTASQLCSKPFTNSNLVGSMLRVFACRDGSESPSGGVGGGGMTDSDNLEKWRAGGVMRYKNLGEYWIVVVSQTAM